MEIGAADANARKEELAGIACIIEARNGCIDETSPPPVKTYSSENPTGKHS